MEDLLHRSPHHCGASGACGIARHHGRVILFIKASYLEPMLFVREAPFVPILLFILAIFCFVALAYWLGARRVLGSSLADALRDDTVL